MEVTSTNLADVTTVIHDRNLTRPVDIDGALRLDPSTTDQAVSESDALSRWSHLQTTTNGGATKVAIVHTDATLALPINANIKTRTQPYRRVPSWTFITYAASRPSSCPPSLATAPPTAAPTTAPRPQVLDVTLVADDGTGRIVSYSTRGSGPCPASPVHAPRADVAETWTSIPWRYTTTGVRAPGYRTLVRDNVSFTVPACSRYTGTSQSHDGNAIVASVFAAGARADCAPAPAGTSRFQRLRTAPLGPHAALGPVGSPRQWPTITDGTTTPPTQAPGPGGNG